MKLSSRNGRLNQRFLFIIALIAVLTGIIINYCKVQLPQSGDNHSTNLDGFKGYEYRVSLDSETFSRYGFTFNYPIGMVFTRGGLLGGFDQTPPVLGDLQGVHVEIPEVMGVIWQDVISPPSLSESLQDILYLAEVSGNAGSFTLCDTGSVEKNGYDVLLQYFELVNTENVSHDGIVGVWYDENVKRFYMLYVVSASGVMSCSELMYLFESYLDTFDTQEVITLNMSLEPYWPSEGWRYAAAEQVGMDKERLDLMFDDIQNRIHGLDSIMVIRDGYIIIDAYFPPYDEYEVHSVYSCTKSVVSTLIGIAIDEGYIESLDVSVLDIFEDIAPLNNNQWKRDMTIRDLLMMSAGFNARDSYLYQWEGLDRMHENSNWVEYVLDLEVTWEPGSKFEYTNGVSHLLSSIITETTGMTASEYAEEKLFKPLGITNYYWDLSPEGNNWGYSGLYLTPHDMAKIGYLFLNHGVWDGQQVVPKDWVREATRQQIRANTLLDGYGYQWWISDNGYYSAIGYKGQFIQVFPEERLIVVTTGSDNAYYNSIWSLLEQHILPAIED